MELAQARVDVGSASNADVYRWESELASATQAVIQARTTHETAKLQLNTLLANTLEREYDVEDVTIDDELYQSFRNAPMVEFVKTPRDMNLATDFMVQEALQDNPNKKLLLANIQAAERTNTQNQRLLYTPQVALEAQAGRVFLRDGAGSTEVPGFPLQDDTWQVGVSLNYSIFQGNLRRANLQRSRIQLEQFGYSQERLDQQLELAVRAGVLTLLAASTNIEFSQTASDNAQLNFELVQENYREGKVIITQLIDAQRAALQAKLGYAFSVYQYLEAQLQLEFAIGFFTEFAEPEDIDAFQQRFESFKNER